MEYDAAIIGGGLAGLTLAIQLAKQGRKVVLFEKEKYPFHKVCGEYVSMESWPFLERCGLHLSEMNLPSINQLEISAPNGKLITHPLTSGGFGISRYILDASLAELAKNNGVMIFDQCKVNHVEHSPEGFIINTSIGIYRSWFAFGSYGKRSNIDIKTGRNFTLSKHSGQQNYIAVKYHIKTDHQANLIALHNFKNGYCGISKIEDDKYCLCYLTTEKNLKDSANDIHQMEAQILSKNKYLKEIFNTSEFLYDAPLVISQINFEPKTQVENHLILLGDAAGLITPLCGNGMSMAMRSSHLIANLIPDESNEKDLLNFEIRYQKAWQKEFATRLAAGRFIQHLFGAENLTNTFIRVVKPFPFLVQQLVQLTHGKPF